MKLFSLKLKNILLSFKVCKLCQFFENVDFQTARIFHGTKLRKSIHGQEAILADIPHVLPMGQNRENPYMGKKKVLRILPHVLPMGQNRETPNMGKNFLGKKFFGQEFSH